MDFLRNDYRNLDPKRITTKNETHYHQKELLRKCYASMMVIGDSTVAGLRRYPTVRRDSILPYKTINLGIGGDRVENVLWRINDIVLSISHRYSNIEIIVSGLLPRDFHWSTQRVKINKTNDYLKGYCER